MTDEGQAQRYGRIKNCSTFRISADKPRVTVDTWSEATGPNCRSRAPYIVPRLCLIWVQGHVLLRSMFMHSQRYEGVPGIA